MTMDGLELIVGRRKGEALLSFENETFERILLLFHANSLPPVSHTLHFGLKPGHLFVYVKRRGDAEGRWVIKDAGYLNYFRMDQTTIKQTQYNTLDKQKLFTKGWLRIRRQPGAVDLSSLSFFPLHRRTVTFSYGPHHAYLLVRDAYLGARHVYWNMDEGFEASRAAFRQTRRIDL